MTKYNMADIHKKFSADVRELNPELFGPLGIEAHRTLDDALRPKRGNKYGAKRIEVDGKKFDSQAEYRRYLVLRNQEEAGEISSLILQCEICLLEGFTFQGEKVRPIRYTCDFCYVKNGITYVEDVKSEATKKSEAFRIRWRLLLWLYKDIPDVRCVIVD